MTTRSEARPSGGAARNANQKSGQSSRAQSANGGDAASDELYGVVSVLYHALQGNETYAKYCDDARNAGDEELVEFFESCRAEESQRAQRAKELLADRLEGDIGEEDDEDDEDDEGDGEASSDDEDDDT